METTVEKKVTGTLGTPGTPGVYPGGSGTPGGAGGNVSYTNNGNGVDLEGIM